MESFKQQYETLTDDEKKALLVYKSRLGLLINTLDNNPDFEGYYNRYKNIFSNIQNMMIQKTAFSNINFDSLDDFIKSIYDTKALLDEVTTKMTSNQGLKLFRMISTDEDIEDISKDNIVSTSLSLAEVFKYGPGGNKIYIYEIDLPIGSHFCYVPSRIKYNEKENRLILSNSADEEEIILNKDIYEFEEKSRISDNGITYITCVAHDKLNKTRI